MSDDDRLSVMKLCPICVPVCEKSFWYSTDDCPYTKMSSSMTFLNAESGKAFCAQHSDGVANTAA